MIVKYKSISNLERLQEKILDFKSDMDSLYGKKYSLTPKNYSDYLELSSFFLFFLGLFYPFLFALFSLNVVLGSFFLKEDIYHRYNSYFSRFKSKIKFKQYNEYTRYKNLISEYFINNYKVIDEELINQCNEFYGCLNTFEKRHIKYFLSKDENNNLKFNSFNNVCYESVLYYLKMGSTLSLIENRDEIFCFIDLVQLPSLQDELIEVFNTRIKNTKHEMNKHKMKYNRFLIEEEIKNCDILSQQLNTKKKIKNQKNNKIIIQNI